MDPQKKATPKSFQVRISAQALGNIDEITGYIAFINGQAGNAIRVGDEIFKTIDRIGKNPHAFKQCEEIPTKSKIYRRAICLSWIIVFRIVGMEIVILGIIHQSRKPAKLSVLRKIK